MRLHEREGVGEQAGVDAPHRFAAEHLGAEVGDRVGDERAREQRLHLAVLGVVEHHLGALDRARGVREVVAEDLVLVELGDGDAAVDVRGAREMVGGDGDDVGRAVDRGRSRRELVGHGRQPTDGPRAIVRVGVWRVVGSVARRWACVGSGSGGVVGGASPGATWSAAGAGGVVAIVPPPLPPPDRELDEPELGATWVLPSLSMVALVAPSTFCSVTPHCASTSWYTVRAR